MNQVVLLATLIVMSAVVIAFFLFLFTLFYATWTEETVQER